ncbi:AraC family transcriptional regulator [Paenibacillus hodogayensis]|uniref:AraC family transcriptional regulator n=1 Tax=Paenibacillus hodogayensis TaxID=279208 RepID=A0ABV5VWX9_9BACL
MSTRSPERPSRTLLLLSSVRRIRRSGPRFLTRRVSPAPMLCCVIAGSGTLRLDGEAFPAEPSRLYYIPAGAVIEAEVGANGIEYVLIVTRPVAVPGKRALHGHSIQARGHVGSGAEAGPVGSDKQGGSGGQVGPEEQAGSGEQADFGEQEASDKQTDFGEPFGLDKHLDRSREQVASDKQADFGETVTADQVFPPGGSMLSRHPDAALPFLPGLLPLDKPQEALLLLHRLEKAAGKTASSSPRRGGPEPEWLLYALLVLLTGGPERELAVRTIAIAATGTLEAAVETKEPEHKAEDQTTRSSDSVIQPCIAYIQEHYSRKISRETLADIAKLTPNAFCRSFKRVTGVSPTDYINRIRIERAKDLLSPAGSVKDVAASVGYVSEYYFSRMFKKTVGLSPTLFIKRERLRVATASRNGFHDNLSFIGVEAAAGVDCYRYPWMDDAEYNRKLQSQLGQLRLVKPDLIIADYFHAGLYKTLNEIAPTVLLEHHLDWKLTHRKLAELTGREREAEQTFRLLEERKEEARSRLERSERAGTVAVMQLLPSVVRLQGAVNHPLNELLYLELGLKPGQSVPLNKMREEWPAASSASLLPENNLSDTQTDYLFIYRHEGEIDFDFATAIKKLPGAVHTRFIANWLHMSWTPAGRLAIIDEIISTLG